MVYTQSITGQGTLLSFGFLCSPKGEHIVAALSLRLTVRPSHFCPEHISKSIEDSLMIH